MTNRERKALGLETADLREHRRELRKAAEVIRFDFTNRYRNGELNLEGLPDAAALGYHTAAAMYLEAFGELPTGVVTLPVEDFDRCNKAMVKYVLKERL